MSLSANDLSAPAGTSVKFNDLGDKVSGVVTYVGPFEERVNPNNNNLETQAKVVLEDNGEALALYVVKGKPIAQAIADALRASGANSLEVGGTLTVQHHDLKDTGKPNKLKLFRAKYEAPAAGFKAAELVDDAPF